MLIKFINHAGRRLEQGMMCRLGSLQFNFKTSQTDYFYENERFIFFIDTNISKEKEVQIQTMLDDVRDLHASKLEKIFHGNYFIVAICKRNYSIHLLRDPSGVKTGYYTAEANGFCVGSVMHEVARWKKQVEFDDEAVHQMLYSGYLLNGFTFYKDVGEVPMGNSLRFDSRFKFENKKYTPVRMAQQDNSLSAKENFYKLRKEAQLAHKGHIASQNRVLLSGGLDSIAMLIALDDQCENQYLDSLSFRVKNTEQDETVYARSISGHLGIPNRVAEIDPCEASNYEDFERKILEMNNPYFGVWIFGNFKGHPNEMFYAGQDTRLHTPALNEVDKLAFSLLNQQDAWWMKHLARPFGRVLISLMKALDWDKNSNRVLKNMFKAAHIFDLKPYLEKFYLKLDKKKIEKKGLPTDYYDRFRKYFEFDLKEIPTPRALYNKLIKLKWKEQYTYDMRYLQDVARMNHTYIAMPFYNKRIAEFSSGIPFRLATKPMVGRAKFGNKKALVYKYVLRHAFRDKLNDLTFYRAKAVSSILHQLFNGVLGDKIRGLLEEDLNGENDSFIRKYKLENFVNRFLKEETWSIHLTDADYLQTVYYIGTMIVYHKQIVQPKEHSERMKTSLQNEVQGEKLALMV